MGWDAEAEHVDEEPDDGPLDSEVRATWADLCRLAFPVAGRVLDAGCGTDERAGFPGVVGRIRGES